MKNDETKGFCLFYDWIDDLDYLDGESAWQIVKAICSYYRNGENPVDIVTKELKATVSIIFHQIQRKEAISTARSNAGQKGGFAKAKGSKAIAEPKQKLPTDTITYTNTNNIYPPKSPKEKNNALFDTFWEKYPRKQGRAAAQKAFNKINPDETLLQTMLKAIDLQKQTSQWQDPQFIPYPATWLNREQWEDIPTQKHNTLCVGTEVNLDDL